MQQLFTDLTRQIATRIEQEKMIRLVRLSGDEAAALHDAAERGNVRGNLHIANDLPSSWHRSSVTGMFGVRLADERLRGVKTTMISQVTNALAAFRPWYACHSSETKSMQPT